MPQWEMPPPAVPAREDLPSIPAARSEEVQSDIPASLDPTPSIPPPPTLLLNLASTNNGEYLWSSHH